MNASQVRDLLLSAGCPPEALSSLERDAARMARLPGAADFLRGCLDRYEKGEKFSFFEAQNAFADFAEGSGVHRYTAEFLFYVPFLPLLGKKYREAGVPLCCLSGAAEDLVCKLKECDRVFHVWGSFVANWFSYFFDLSLYTFGRLEFCLTSCPCDFEKDGRSIRKGQPCVDVHIPSKGRLVRRDLDDAYARAAEFFAPRLDGAPVVFHCHSWLLADYHREMLPPGSGILMFSSDYTPVARTGDEGDLWRIFDDADPADPASLPGKTTLQHAYKARLLAGLPVWGGEGLFFFH